ncbi:uncharacterized protein LOC117123010 [Anneissia japonica]|uniref:uncharacterized protein LOC117123010 n=1 Tax=Anneissia japonica TaxID=1529436 RepID=UPI001425AC58|nr:uncharacterized protein LOC117123010 [Anneissia japonica]XP_033124689.1 uncharacterized protein LOC117123010 [Anneissia japonica]
MDSTKSSVIISTTEISVNVSDVSESDSTEEQTPAFLEKTSTASQQRILLNLDVGAVTRMRRRSAPSLKSIQESPVEKHLSKPLLLADINRPPTPTTSKNFLSRPSNVRHRRGSCPAILEPIKEGLFSEHDKQATARASSLSPNLNRQRRKNSADQPHVGLSQGLVITDHQFRLRSNSSPISIETKKPLAVETLFPRPRRNSLGCATLDELKGQYKLLDSRSKVQEEEVSIDSSSCNFNLLEPTSNVMHLSESA